MTETQFHQNTLKEFSPSLSKLNRYGTIIPYQHSLVKLQCEPNEESDDERNEYINASWLNTCTRMEKSFVATQGPMSNTFNNFWKMCWQYEIENILMLCNFNENDKQQCEQYWPQTPGSEMQYNLNIVRFEKEEISQEQIVKRTFLMYRRDTEKTKIIY